MNFSNKKPVAIIISAILIIALIVVIKMKQKNITIVIGDDTQTITTYGKTVEKVLNSNNITLGEKDKIEPALDSLLNKNDTITIKRAKNITVYLDGKNLTFLSAEDNIASMIQAEGISIQPEDKVEPIRESILTEDMHINIVRVETKEITENIALDYSTEIQSDNNILDIFKKTVQYGEKGSKDITYRVVYEDGKEVSRSVVKENITKQPVNEIVVKGTQSAVALSRGGDPMSYSRKVSVKSTAYWAVNGVGSTYTSSGKLAQRNSEGYSTIAVDTSVFPYGTKMYIPGYGFAIAADTGSSILGNKIDVYFNTKQEALNWAVKNVTVYVLE